MDAHAGKMTSAVNSAKRRQYRHVRLLPKGLKTALSSRLVVGSSAGKGLALVFRSYAIVVFGHRRNEASNLHSQSRHSFGTKVLRLYCIVW